MRAVAGAITTVLASTPFAEEPDAPANPPEATAHYAIEEIVVTSRKREESLQDVPVAVTAIGEEQLRRYNVADLKKIAQMTPQLFVAEAVTGNGGAITIRGIGTGSTSSGFDQAVSIYVDGLQYDRGNVLSQGYFDLSRVEVLKGPQALFFGKNSTAGVISMSSADPGDELEITGRIGREFYADENWYEAIASGPINEVFGARLALRYDTVGGYLENVSEATTDAGSQAAVPAPAHRDWPGKREFLGRLTLAYRPTPAFDVKLKVAGADLSTAGPSQINEIFKCSRESATLDPAENCKADWKIRQNDIPRVISAPEPLFDVEKGRLFQNYQGYNAALTANYDLGDTLPLLTSVTGYTRYETIYAGDLDFTGTSLFPGAENISHESYSEELRLLTRFDFPVNAMIGGYYQATNFLLRNALRLLPVPADPATGKYVTWQKHSPTDGMTASAFGQLIWNVTRTVEFSPGVRYSRVTKDSFSVHDYLHPAALPLFRPVDDVFAAKFSDQDLSPEIPLMWRPEVGAGTELTLYTAYKRGFKSGGFSNSEDLRTEKSPESAIFDSEKVWGVESGIKSTWLDRALLFNIVGYRYEFSDLQVNFFDAEAITFDVENAAAATTTGAEAEFRWLPPVDGLDFQGALSYNEAVYDDFLAFCYAGQTRAEGCNLDDAGAPASPGSHQQIAGMVTPIAPRWTAGMGFTYERPLFAGLSWLVAADSNYVDDYLLSSIGRPDVIQEHYFRTNASFRLLRDDGRWALSVFGRNLSNEYTISLPSVDSPGSGGGTGTDVGVRADQLGSAERPREVGIELTARF